MIRWLKRSSTDEISSKAKLAKTQLNPMINVIFLKISESIQKIILIIF